MLTINESKSGVVPGVGANKFRVAIDGTERGDVDDRAARDLAMETAAANGFGNGGLCDNAVIGPVGADGEMLDGHDVLDPAITVIGFRAEFMFANRV